MIYVDVNAEMIRMLNVGEGGGGVEGVTRDSNGTLFMGNCYRHFNSGRIETRSFIMCEFHKI